MMTERKPTLGKRPMCSCGRAETAPDMDYCRTCEREALERSWSAHEDARFMAQAYPDEGDDWMERTR